MIIKQYKLANGETVISEIVGFDEKLAVVVTRNPMKINEMFDQNNNLFYGFREFILYQGQPPVIVGINYHNVISESFPHKNLVKQYNESLIGLNRSYTEDIDISFDSSFEPTHIAPTHIN